MIRLPLALFLLAALAPRVARSAESAPYADPRNTATLVAESDSVAPGKPVVAALRLRLAPGWHTYWRNPGDAGIPAELDWTLPAGAHAGEIAWPAPERITEGDLVTFAHTGEVLLPVRITGLAGAASIALHATWLACEKVCVPEEASFRLDLPAGNGAPGADEALFQAAKLRLPRAVSWSAFVAPSGALDIAVPELGAAQVRDALFVADAPDRIAAGAAQPLAVREGGLRLDLRATATARLDQGLSGVLLLTDQAGGRSAFQIAAQSGPLPPVPAATPLALTLGFAFLGGLILNLMPCVFPVLAMKAAGLAHLRDPARARGQAAAYTLGVVLAFCAIGGALLALRAAGSLAGWGFQFAQPGFVAATAWVLFAVGLNLSGVFAVDGLGVAGIGQGLAGRGGTAGSFFTGVLAVVVATPCTAPFMSAALAVGLAAPPLVALAVFAALGLGLAAPYALLAATPGAARMLPRPGAWMEVLRQALAFPMYGAAVWLLWVVGQEAGPDGVVATAGAGVALAFALWLVGVMQRGGVARPGLSAALRAVAILVTVGAIALGQRTLAHGGPAAAAAVASPGVEPFSLSRLAELRAQNRPVLVDMTAAWCITCLVNQRVALDRDAVRAELSRLRAVLLRGDWTRQDPVITAFLHGYGRDGVPLYVVYPVGGRPPFLLPQILTETLVIDALRRAADGSSNTGGWSG